MKTTIFGLTLLLAVNSFAWAKNKNELTILAYNIMQLPFQNWDQTQRMQRIPDAIRTIQPFPDVIALSEVFTDEAMAELAQLKDIYPYITPVVGHNCRSVEWQSSRGACSSSPFVIRGGVMIMSRWPISSMHQYIFHGSDRQSWDYFSNKGAAYVEVVKNGQPYHIVATHLQATHDDDSRQEHRIRMEQLYEMKMWLNSFGIPKSEPLILAGDFNVESKKVDEYLEMLHISQTTIQYHFKDDAASYPERNWLARAGNQKNGYDMCYNDTLDYILVREDHLQPKSPAEMNVIPLKSEDTWYWSSIDRDFSLCYQAISHNGMTRDLSDHYPVIATLNF
ncbi:sphingomyelin phosphodiesterase [Algicola sagamiensis]|uniref:sphingomyelin phosphodiesterase n=1 Tax=Algicola sagamiensis TaxID=163869 RepID=UPI000361A945|nr:sphingomyelin phosphodiesterase [Algicola sagamiensis]